MKSSIGFDAENDFFENQALTFPFVINLQDLK